MKGSNFMKMQRFPTKAGDVSYDTELRFVGTSKLCLENIEANYHFDYAVRQLFRDNHLNESDADNIEKPSTEQFEAIRNKDTAVELILIKGQEVQVRTGVGVLFTLKDKGAV